MSDEENDDEWFFDILGNDVRRKIIQLLSRGPTSMKQFTDAVNVSRQAILKQLEQMRSKGLVEARDMELEEDEKRKGPPARVYNLTKFFKVEYEVNPSFTEPLITKLFLLPGDVTEDKATQEDPNAKYPVDMRQCFQDLAKLDEDIQGLQVKHRELYQKKVDLINRLKARIDDSFEEDEEKEILLYMLAHPARSLEGMLLSELASVVPMRRDFLEAVLASLQKHGYIEKKGERYRIKQKV
ncbi:MAG: helix-turn-helix domain-containing protein [Candidatus Lokiarchaeota archaeon]|nr:helix-turn-helix domain-containing protein [Candidatus Lokiarchaeota archaeon]